MFIITKRQYDIIMQQAQACYPQESGGILGGRDNVILGILPSVNMYLYDRTNTFGLTQEDIDRGYQFLEKNKMKYYGIYHSHPKGIPYPSKEDLAHGQKYLFIVGLADRYNPDLYAYQVEKGEVFQIPIRVVDESLVEQFFLSKDQHKLSDAAPADEMAHLAGMINDMIEGRVQYPKDKPTRWDISSFSTKA